MTTNIRSANLALMAQIWGAQLDSTTKMVALCFAKHLSDVTGLSWPSMLTVARECSLRSERTASNHTKRLEAMGVLTPVARANRPAALAGIRSKVYALNAAALPVPTQLNLPTGDADATQPPHIHAAQHADGAPPPAQQPAADTDTDALIWPELIWADDAQLPDTAPQSTHQPAPKAAQAARAERATAPRRAAPAASTLLDGFAAPENIAAWLKVRADKRKPALTAADVADLCQQAQLAGLTLDEALTQCIARNWAAFDHKWLTTARPLPTTDAATSASAAPAVQLTADGQAAARKLAELAEANSKPVASKAAREAVLAAYHARAAACASAQGVAA